mgnify:CR=1 FL=1
MCEGREFSLESGERGGVEYRSGARAVEVSTTEPVDPALRTNLAVACAAIEAWLRPSDAEMAVGMRAALKSPQNTETIDF